MDLFTKGSARQGHTVMRALYDAGTEAVPDLGRIEVPTVVVIGGSDAITPPGVCQVVVDRMRDATAEMMPGMGHFPTVTHADDLVQIIQTRFG